MTLNPAPPDTGLVFRRTDLDGFEVEAHVRNVARVSYATSLMKKGVWLSTIEHLLAALYSCGVDNVYIDIDALEVPILDGSAQPWIDLIERAGIRTLRRRRRYIKVQQPLEVTDGQPGTAAFRSIGIYPADGDGKAGGDVLNAIKKAYGGYEAWDAEFRRTAMSLAGGSGWCVLTYNALTNELRNQWAWDHLHGAIAGVPLLALDMYEHSYHMDYGTAAAKYVDAFMRNVNWEEVERRFATRASVA